LFKKEGVRVEDAARKHLEDYFAFLHSERDQHFGNARSVRQVVGESVKNQHLRLASMKKEERTPELMEMIIFDDVKEFEMIASKSKRPSIGFQTGKN
jgi:hypothetical protein